MYLAQVECAGSSHRGWNSMLAFQTLPRSFQGVPAGGMAPEPWAPPGNAGLSSNSAFLLPPFVFFLLFPPRCFFPFLSKALCFLPLSLLPFRQSSLSQPQEQAEHCRDICGTTWTRYVCSGVSQGVLGHAVPGELQLP